MRSFHQKWIHQNQHIDSYTNINRVKQKHYSITVNGGWGNWMTVSVDHCVNDPDGEVKQIRYCNNPEKEFGGDPCPDPEYNERYISCKETDYEGNYFYILDMF